MQDKIIKGRLRVLHGSNKPDSKFNENDVKEICELLENGYRNDFEIMKLLGKTDKDVEYLKSYKNLIQNIKQRHCWLDVVNNYNF